jgi:DNA invertase Pin-like site-specific DNA recombinase
MIIKSISPEKEKVAFYMRLSREDGDDLESESISTQRQILKDFTNKNNLCVAGEYVDDGCSGTNFERPNFIKLIEDIKDKKINFIVTKDMSRLGRDYIGVGNYIEKFFPDNHIRYVSVLDGIDTGVDCAANEMIPFKAILNDMYAKDISKKVKSVFYQKKMQGLFTGNKAPYGYKKFEKYKFVIDKPAAEIVKRIFDMAIQGMSYRNIAHTLTSEGIPNPSNYSNFNKGGGLYNDCWNNLKVKQILKDRVYSGDMVQGKRKKINYKSKKIVAMPEDKFIIVENTHEPIISREDFEKAQLVTNIKKYSRQRKNNYLLKGLITCEGCKGSMSLFTQTNKSGKVNSYLSCANYRRFPALRRCTSHLIRLDYVTNFTIEKIKEFCKYFKTIKYDQKDTEKAKKEINSLKIQIEGLNQKIDKIYEDKLSGLIEIDVFSRMYSKLDKNKKILDEKLKTLGNCSVSNHKIYFETKKAVENFLSSAEYTTETIISLVEKVEVKENKSINIIFRYQ